MFPPAGMSVGGRRSGWLNQVGLVIGDAATRVEVKFAALQLQSGYPDDPPQGGNVPMGNFGELSSEILYSQVELKRSKAAHLFNVCWCALNPEGTTHRK